MSKFKIGDKVRTVDGLPWVGEYRGVEVAVLEVRDSPGGHQYLKTRTAEGVDLEGTSREFNKVEEGAPESPDHYSRLKALTGVEPWDILDFVAGEDPDMWNLGKYWFRMGHKEGQSTLVEKKKMLKYLERSIAKGEAAK